MSCHAMYIHTHAHINKYPYIPLYASIYRSIIHTHTYTPPETGPTCRIAVAQPRRLSAVSVAERIAAERCEPIGNTVGFNIRLESEKSQSTQVCVLICICYLMWTWNKLQSVHMYTCICIWLSQWIWIKLAPAYLPVSLCFTQAITKLY